MSRYRSVRGTFDVLPEAIPRWRQLESLAHEIADSFGYREIRTPVFEEAELFTIGMGVLAGIVERELWTFHDKFGKKLALRADMTSGIVRALNQSSALSKNNDLVKVYYLGSVFLLGKDTEEGSRQGHQFGVEVLGSHNPAIDAEVIALALSFCEKAGLEGCMVELNSLGGATSRPLYNKKLKEYFSTHSADLCDTCKRKYRSHPNWVLSCDEEGCTALSQVAPTIYAMLGPDCRSHFNSLKEHLDAMEVPYELNPRVVRDTEYYNRTIFQIRVGGKVVAFGGRYDGLCEQLGGSSTPAVGFAVSMETLCDLLEQRNEPEDEGYAPVVLFDPEGPEATKVMVPALHQVRQRGIRAELAYAQSYGARYRKTARYVVKLNESNAYRGHALVEDRYNGGSEKVSAGKLGEKLLKILKISSNDEAPKDRGSRKKLSRRKKGRGSEKDEKDNVQESPKESRQSKEKERSRRRSRGRDREEREEVAEEAATNDKEDRKRTRRRRSSRDEKDSSPPVSKNEETGKAVIPSLVLSAAAPPPESRPAAAAKSQTKAKSQEKSAPPLEHVPEMSSGGLNWSLAGLGGSESSESPSSEGKKPRKRKRRTSKED